MGAKLVISFKNLSRFNDNVHNILILLSPRHFPHLCTLNLLFIELIIRLFVLSMAFMPAWKLKWFPPVIKAFLHFFSCPLIFCFKAGMMASHSAASLFQEQSTG